MKPLRIATVPYLNIAPFVEALRSRVALELIQVRPSSLLRCWRSRELDLCLLSTADLLAMRLRPLRGGAISADGPVESVAFFSARPMSQWDRVALDASSVTSNRLAGLILRERFCLDPELTCVPRPLAALQRADCDAALIIGDPALEEPPPRHGMDLAAVWSEWTGYPFVFAAWVSGRETRWSTGELESLLHRARIESAKFVRRCASAHARRLRVSTSRLVRYLSTCISYQFGVREQKGMGLFHQMTSLAEETRAPRRLELDALVHDRRGPA